MISTSLKLILYYAAIALMAADKRDFWRDAVFLW